jgi:hypothetical protein
VRTRSYSGQLHDPQPPQRPRPRSHPVLSVPATTLG